MPELTDTDQRAITRRSKKLTKDQAKRALYIDFEGLKKENGEEVTPTILGTLDITSTRKRKFKAFILHENLHLLTRPRLYPEHGVSKIDREVIKLNEAIPSDQRKFSEIDELPGVLLNIGNIYFRNKEYVTKEIEYHENIYQKVPIKL